VGYNLGLAALFALAVTTAFALAATLAEAAGRQGLPVRRPLAAGAAAAVLLAVMGNLRGGWDAITSADPIERFNWFDASRVVPDTINEFPAFSFTVGDLHAHVIAIPLTLLALAFVAQFAMEGPPAAATRRGAWETGCAALAIGILYAVNSWSWPVLAGLLVVAAGLWLRDERSRGRRGAALAWCGGVLALGLVLVLPFLVGFDPNAGGIGTVPEARREPLGRFLGHQLVLFGALLWLLAAPLAARALAARHPARVAVWGAAVLVVGLSLTAGARLAGALLVALLAGVALAAALRRQAAPAERLLWALAAGALALIAAPEVVYVRDEFESTDFLRMNTVFKLGYQAWILLAIAGAVFLAAARAWLPRAGRAAWQAVAAGLVVVSCAYPVAAAAGRTAGFADGPRLDGREWLERSAPGDVRAIDWLRARTPGDAVVLEAVGDDYSPFGNGRISTYTGRPTVLGWQGHELQWSHDVGSRRADVQTLYTTRDAAAARDLVRRYGVDYAVVGPLERTTYGEPGVLPSLGRKAFERDGTAVYALTASGR
jgi:YYY domain-containing protein